MPNDNINNEEPVVLRGEAHKVVTKPSETMTDPLDWVPPGDIVYDLINGLFWQSEPSSTLICLEESEDEEIEDLEEETSPEEEETLTEETPTLEISEIVLPNDNVSFTTESGENEITLTALVHPESLAADNNPNIEWELEDDPAKAGSTPLPTGVSSLRGNQVTVTINIPKVPAGRNWNTLNYRVRAKVNIDGSYIYSDWRTFAQDERDMLRQQYIDMGKDKVPARTEFINSGSSTYFRLSEGACKCGHHTYHLWSIMSNLDSVRTNLGYSMTVNSGYPCPIYNANIRPTPGAKNSQHIYGKAADIAVQDFNGDGKANSKDWNRLATAAASASYIEPYEDTRTWVHMDWR